MFEKISLFLNKKGYVFRDFLLLSFLSGILTGVFVTVYIFLTKFFMKILYQGDPVKTIHNLPVWYVYLVPVVSILIVNYLISLDETVREYGIAKLSDIVSQNSTLITIKSLFLKIIASVLSISSGFSVGNEGPSAEIGALVSYHIQKFFKIPEKFIKVIISVGASSGIAAVFVSPLTGIAFAIESIAGEFFKSYIIFMIVGAFSAFSIAVEYFPAIGFLSPSGRFINYDYIWLNIIFIPVITFFIYFYLFLQDKLLYFFNLKVFEKFGKYRNIVFAVFGGMVIGTILLIEPKACFTGHFVVQELFNDFAHMGFSLIAVLILLRIVATSVSLYSNAVGGMFVPLMSIGALIGYGFGEIINMMHLVNIEPYYFAAIGASVFMGVLMKLPFTAVVLSLEITNDYNVVLATGFAVAVIAYVTKLNFNIKKLNTIQIDFKEVLKIK
ncbi:chloride channel protein [Caminibacter sp.]